MQDNRYPSQRSRPWGASLTIATAVIALFGLMAVYFTLEDGHSGSPQAQIAQSK